MNFPGCRSAHGLRVRANEVLLGVLRTKEHTVGHHRVQDTLGTLTSSSVPSAAYDAGSIA